MAKASKQGYKKRLSKLGFTNSQVPSKRLSKIQASRETRRRKKVYIDLLEEKLYQKQQEILKLKTQLQELKHIQDTKHVRFQPNLKQRAKLFDSISSSIQRQDQVETKTYLDILRNKLGVAGQDREQMLYNNLREFTDLLMPMHAKYLIQVCEEKTEFYELFSQNSQYKLHMNFNFLNNNQKKELSSIRPWLCKYKEGYKNIVNQIINLYRIVLQQNTLLQETIDNLQKAFSPCFVAEFLLKLDHKRNSNQIGVIFPVSYLQEKIKQTKQKKKLDKLNEVCSFSLNHFQPTLTNVFDTMQDDFDYLF